MARRTLTIAIALAPAAALLLTACGSTTPKPSTTIPGANSASPSAPSSSPPPSTPAGAPRITLPSDVRVQIEGPDTADAGTEGAVAGLRYAILALRDGFAQDNGQVPSMLHSYALNAGVFWAKRIQTAKSEGRTITGTYRYYDFSVHLNGPDTAGANFCEDQRQAFSKDIKTGKVYRTTPSNGDFYRFTAQLAKDSSGTWKISQESWVQGDKSCIRA